MGNVTGIDHREARQRNDIHLLVRYLCFCQQRHTVDDLAYPVILLELDERLISAYDKT